MWMVLFCDPDHGKILCKASGKGNYSKYQEIQMYIVFRFWFSLFFYWDLSYVIGKVIIVFIYPRTGRLFKEMYYKKVFNKAS